MNVGNRAALPARRGITAIVLMTLAVAVFVGGMAVGPRAEAIRASHVILLDDDGTSRADVKLDQSGSVVLTILATDEAASWGLRIHQDEPTVSVLDESAQERTRLDLMAFDSHARELESTRHAVARVSASQRELERRVRAIEEQGTLLREIPRLVEQWRAFQRSMHELHREVSFHHMDLRRLQDEIARQKRDIEWLEREVRALRDRYPE
jgi:hypothetical protein